MPIPISAKKVRLNWWPSLKPIYRLSTSFWALSISGYVQRPSPRLKNKLIINVFIPFQMLKRQHRSCVAFFLAEIFLSGLFWRFSTRPPLSSSSSTAGSKFRTSIITLFSRPSTPLKAKCRLLKQRC